jgi:hypothetical protein
LLTSACTKCFTSYCTWSCTLQGQVILKQIIYKVGDRPPWPVTRIAFMFYLLWYVILWSVISATRAAMWSNTNFEPRPSSHSK